LQPYSIDTDFKIFVNDIGLLRKLSNIDINAFKNSLNFDFKGYFMENYVIQQLKNNILVNPFYYKEKQLLEIDFLTIINSKVIPIEVKAGLSKRKKSLTSYNNKFKPSFSIRFSTNDFKKDGIVYNIPL
jgi:predicted AAA+ superfamily ATPase